ncbi:MAG: hypothetical protein VB024_08510 [Dysgonamonadaceae bacterium]|nr:hypothetical protein [Dysgonamonadaceae bacterium]MDD3308672.1 hypothetical protein [Dysgonamonadaceae bacterium]MDD3899736.1 hypothetical protein [Dysgonamonadaceae bacterium]MDD4397985.1 hypothetical protein [Dysgonamonadaceae bacterium]MEA5081646.1 hypothetical protein [Dysgonamonadaceae bacterium]
MKKIYYMVFPLLVCFSVLVQEEHKDSLDLKTDFTVSSEFIGISVVVTDFWRRVEEFYKY